MIFTRKNVQRAVRQVKNTNDLGYRLGVPGTRRREIQRQFSSVPQRVKAYIDYFMDHDPLASWRSVIVALDWLEEKEAADNIRHLAESITGRGEGECVGDMESGSSMMCVCVNVRPTLLLTRLLTAHE